LWISVFGLAGAPVGDILILRVTEPARVVGRVMPGVQGVLVHLSSKETGQQPSQPIRVMSYNIHRWAGQDGRLDVGRLAHVIHTAGADVVGLNEVLHPVTGERRTHEPLAELADRLGMSYAFGASGWIDRRGPGWHGPVGNAILSRYPLLDITNTLLPSLQATKQRSLLAATLGDGPSQGLRAHVTHLDHAFEGTRLLQVRAVLRHLPAHGPHYVGGDFNTPGFVGRRARLLLPPVLRYIQRAGYRDAFHEVGKGNGRTFPSASPIFRIDFLFLPAGYASALRWAYALNSKVTHLASDHRPLVAELLLAPHHDRDD
jgi:endonuclease/exonuclease/phosphatase family metal-dependent hydrolase